MLPSITAAAADASNADAQTDDPPKPAELVGRRYRVLDLIGRGGMGAVYRAQDLLAGPVALKRLLATSAAALDSHASTGALLSASQSVSLSLAHEFRTLASLRHRHIISVLDYGFDAAGHPYLTMDLLENAETILEAGSHGNLRDKVELLLQTLHALAYLHRRGIIHRDLKPANVLVTRGQAKLLDFGIAVDREQVSRAVRAGTPGYLAPEVLRGLPASERSDLYALGMIAREWYLARPALAETRDLRSGTDATVKLHTGLLPSGFAHKDSEPTSHFDLDSDAGLGSLALPGGVPSELAPVLDKLLAAEPTARYASAEEVIVALCHAIGQRVPDESSAMRESFLQAARFVGRAAEQQQLGDVLEDALAGRGSGWLLGGESGVGKSRLLEELRALAQVRGAVLLRGQQVSEGASPYHAWRTVLRWLAILTELSDLEASVLKPLVPDIDTLLQRPVPMPAVLDVEVESARLFAVVEDIFLRQRQPMVVFLEDLHWASSESLKLLERLTSRLAELPVLMLGTYRDDERPDLPAQLRTMRVLKLKRLAPSDIGALAESMMGPAGREPQLIQALQQETEGNPFFLVEVVRSLAEEAGRLDMIDHSLPRHTLATRGVQKIVARRLSRVPRHARPLLEVAAVLGRQLDPALLVAVDPQIDLDQWLQEVSASAVVDVEDGRWRFAHDKLREGLLASLPDSSRPSLHLRAGNAIEAVYPGADDRVIALAHHFAEAGDAIKEALYSQRAGEVLLHAGACAEAVVRLERAVLLIDEQRSSGITSSTVTGVQSLGRRRSEIRADQRRVTRRMAHIEALLAEAQYQLGEIDRCRAHAERSLRHFGHPMPGKQLAWLGGTLREVAVRALQTAEPSLFAEDSDETRQALQEVGRLQTRLGDVFIYQQQALPILWSGLRTLNLCEPAGPSSELARGYAQMAVVAGTMPLHKIAAAWCDRALEVARAAGSPADVAFVLSRIAVCHAYLGGWSELHGMTAEATAIVDGLGDFRLAEECRSLEALALQYQGRFGRCLPLWAWVEASARRRGAPQMELLGPLGRSSSVLRLGRADEAIDLIRAAIPKLGHSNNGFEVNVYGNLALAYFRVGNLVEAKAAADKVLPTIATTRPVAHFTHLGVSTLADACLAMWEAGAQESNAPALRLAARAACKAMRNFAKIFPFGEPFALLSEGTEAHLAGRAQRAHQSWERCLIVSRRLQMPYEEGRAHLEIGRHLEPGDPERRTHLVAAARILDDLDAEDDVIAARRELSSN